LFAIKILSQQHVPGTTFALKVFTQRGMLVPLNSLAIQQVSVWLDDPETAASTFDHSVDWAARLSLPLRLVTTPSIAREAGRSRTEAASSKCRRLCAEKNVPFEVCLAPDDSSAIVRVLTPGHLCVVGEGLSAARREVLLQRARRCPATSLLLCPPAARPPGRVLIVWWYLGERDPFLEEAARLCGTLGVVPVVLVLADSEEDATAHWARAVRVFAACRARGFRHYGRMRCHHGRPLPRPLARLLAGDPAPAAIDAVAEPDPRGPALPASRDVRPTVRPGAGR
jgi:hypothetical protein